MSFQTRKRRCNTLDFCIILSRNRFGFQELCSKWPLRGRHPSFCTSNFNRQYAVSHTAGHDVLTSRASGPHKPSCLRIVLSENQNRFLESTMRRFKVSERPLCIRKDARRSSKGAMGGPDHDRRREHRPDHSSSFPPSGNRWAGDRRKRCRAGGDHLFG